MANVQKYTSAATGHLAAHFERQRDEKGEYIKFGNQKIDTARTPMNYNLAPEHKGGQIEFIRRRTTEARTMKRADVNVMCSWVVTLPQNFQALTDSPAGDPQRIFFERTYRFLADRYGEKNIISAYVHLDESAPHLHFAFVPVTPDKKRGGEKVSAKEVLTKKGLQTFHGDLEHHLDSYRDWYFPVLNDATKDGNRTVAELKMQTAHAEVINAEQEALEARTQAEKVRGDIIPLEKHKNALENEIQALQTAKDNLTSSEVEALQGTKTITGGLKGVTFKEFTALKQTAVRVDEMSVALDRAIERAETADSRREIAEQQRDRAEVFYEQKYQDKITTWENQKPSTKEQLELLHLRRENTKLKKEVSQLRQIIESVKDFIKSHAPQLYEKFLSLVRPGDKQRNQNELLSADQSSAQAGLRSS